MSTVRNIRLLGTLSLACVLALLWVDEVFDLPALLLGAAPTPVNLGEAGLESAYILIFLFFFWILTARLQQRIKYLEGLTVICSNCKAIRRETAWIPLEQWLDQESEVRLSHGLCQACMQRLYPDLSEDVLVRLANKETTSP